jgi:hypothetical protein
VEIFDDTSLDLLKSIKNDTVDEFILANPTWVTKS